MTASSSRQHVVVLMGGWSAERDVSLVSGRRVLDALQRLGHRVTELDMKEDVAARLRDLAPDVVFNALHGSPGEDGVVQALLDRLGIAYTHSDAATSALAMDKVCTKSFIEPLGIRMPRGIVIESQSLYARDPLPRPYVLKPEAEGSSVGITIVTDAMPHPIRPEDEGAWHHHDHLLAETYIPGRELTVGVLDDRALGVTELRTSHAFYDYEAKYKENLTQHICPAPLAPEITKAVMDAALRIHRALKCRSISRSDFRYDESQGSDGLYFLEINTQPGLTPLSLLPEQAALQGLSYDDMVARILASAGTSTNAGMNGGTEA